MAMVKAFAYGSGIIETARLLEFNGVEYLAVAYTDEAITLRNNGIELPIMVMNATLDEPNALIKHDLEPEIYSLAQLKAYLKVYRKAGEKLPAHLIINTGMNRLINQMKMSRTLAAFLPMCLLSGIWAAGVSLYEKCVAREYLRSLKSHME